MKQCTHHFSRQKIGLLNFLLVLVLRATMSARRLHTKSCSRLPPRRNAFGMATVPTCLTPSHKSLQKKKVSNEKLHNNKRLPELANDTPHTLQQHACTFCKTTSRATSLNCSLDNWRETLCFSCPNRAHLPKEHCE